MPVAYFFFCGADKERVKLCSLIREWCRQLIEAYPEVLSKLLVGQNPDKHRKASADEVSHFFYELLEHAPPCYLTVDALDECEEIEKVENFFNSIPRRFKILVVSRNCARVRTVLSSNPRKPVCFEIQPEHTAADVDLFINSKLENITPRLEADVMSTILTKLETPNKTFLWVKLLFQETEQEIDDSEIIECVDKMPRAPNDVYDRILARVNQQDPLKRLLAHLIFFWVVSMRRPISVSELRGLLTVSFESNTFDKHGISSYDDKELLSYCGGLVQTRYAENTIWPAHFTVLEYLRKIMGKPGILEEVMSYYSIGGMRSYESLAAAVCLQYLCSPDIESLRKPNNRSEANELLQSYDSWCRPLAYAASQWQHHLGEVRVVEPRLLELVLRFLDPKHQNIDVWWHIYWFTNVESLNAGQCPTLSGTAIISYFGLDIISKELKKIRWSHKTVTAMVLRYVETHWAPSDRMADGNTSCLLLLLGGIGMFALGCWFSSLRSQIIIQNDA